MVAARSVVHAVGSAQRTLDFGAQPFASGASILRAGESAYFQLGYRDSASAGAGFNLCNGGAEVRMRAT